MFRVEVRELGLQGRGEITKVCFLLDLIVKGNQHAAYNHYALCWFTFIEVYSLSAKYHSNHSRQSGAPPTWEN